MQEKRIGERFVVSFPIRVMWKDENGTQITEEGLTENIGPRGALVFLPHNLPQVGTKVDLTVTENAEDEVSVQAEVLRLQRDPSHPQAALQLTQQYKSWEEKVWTYAAELVANAEPDEFDDW